MFFRFVFPLCFDSAWCYFSVFIFGKSQQQFRIRGRSVAIPEGSNVALVGCFCYLPSELKQSSRVIWLNLLHFALVVEEKEEE